MRMMIILVMTIYSFCTFADDHGHDDHNDHGDEKKKEESIVLTEQAKNNFGIKVQRITPKGNKAELPIGAIVDSEDKKQIFVFHDGKYEIRDVKILKKSSATVTVDEFHDSEDVVISGVNFLKVVEMSHGEEGGGGHGH